MKKDFAKWHQVKERVNDIDSSRIYFKEREIWWCYCGLNIGMEEGGKGDKFTRPILIVKKFNQRLCLVIPLSIQVAKGNFFFPLLSEANIIRIAILPQIRMIDSKRLIERIDGISSAEYRFIKEKITKVCL